MRSRSTSAASTAEEANSPATMSEMATATFIGSPSGSPVMLMIPPRPCIRKSYPGRPASGPSEGNPRMAQWTIRGLIRSSEGKSTP